MGQNSVEVERLACMNKRYTLASGTQVREEDFGLLFYQMDGPWLHFVASGRLLSEDFFQGKVTLGAWCDTIAGDRAKKGQAPEAIARALQQLTSKGVIIEC